MTIADRTEQARKMTGINTDKVTNIQLFCFRVLGLWPRADSGYLYSIYGISFLFIFSLAYTVFMVINLFVLDDMSQMTDTLYMSLTEVALFVKIVNFFMRSKAMQTMLSTVHNFQLACAEEEQLVRKRLTFFLGVSIYYYSCANSAIVTSVAVALTTKEIRLPFNGWYPLDWKQGNANYWLVFVYQTVGMIVTANANITIELFPMILMYMASVKVEILGLRMCRIGWDERPTIQTPDNSETADRVAWMKARSELIASIDIYKHICL